MIRLLNESDRSVYARLRHRALTEAPLSFAASLDDDFAAEWRPEWTVFGAFDGESLAGLAGILPDSKLKSAHKAHIWGMYVAPEHRRRGLGKALLEAAIAHARTLPGVTLLSLTVTDAAPEACRLYEQAGFRVWGTHPDALHHDGRSVADHHMLLAL